MELDVRQPLVLPPGDSDKSLLDELFAAVFSASGIDVVPHVHRTHADGFYVLDGELTFFIRGEQTTLRAGDFALAPPWLVHNFVSSEASVLNLHAPGDRWKWTRLARREGRRATADEIDQHDPPADGGLPRSEGIVRRAGEGELLEADDRRLWILAAQPQLCVFLFDADDGYVGPSTHVHRQHLDAFYVLEGALAFELDGESVDAPAGTWVAAPPGTAHTFRNAGGGRVRFLYLHAPGLRFDEYLRRQAAGEDGREFHESFDVYEP